MSTSNIKLHLFFREKKKKSKNAINVDFIHISYLKYEKFWLLTNAE